MIGLVQRVSNAAVVVDDETVGAIGRGVLLLLGVERGDTEREGERLLERVVGYRMFADGAGKMNRSLADVGGELLIVSQFTLPANTQKGMRPSFTHAAHPDLSRTLYDHFVMRANALQPAPVAKVATGKFGERMAVSLCNDGPVTFWLQVSPSAD